MIIDLPIPQTRDELSLHRVGSWENEGNSISSDASAALKNPSQSQEPHESSFCPHAVSFGSFVYGVRPSNKSAFGQTHEIDCDADCDEGGPWISWKRSFAPYNVCRVTSNHDGSIIVCSTDAGTVALLRGIDGAVIATRKVALEEGNQLVPSPQISFLAQQPALLKNNVNEAIAIGVPSSISSAFVLVSNIDARSLNHNNPLQVSEAARKMTIRKSLKFPRSSRDADIVTTCGLFIDLSCIRFFTLDKQDTLSAYDYDCSDKIPEEKALTVVAPDISWQCESDKQNFTSVDFSMGLRLHNLHPNTTFVVFSDFHSKGSTVRFLDPTRLTVAGSFEISSTSLDKTRKRAKLLALEPLTSAMPESALAVAVAFQASHDSTSGAFIHVMQALVNTDEGTLGTFHRVYAIRIDEPLNTLSMAMFAPTDFGFYSFRYKIYNGDENYSCKVFEAGENNYDGSTIGKIRLLIRVGKFDEADHLVRSAGEHCLIADACAEFHPSEISLGRLQRILKGGSISDKAKMLEAKQCFQRLSVGCLSGSERAGTDLLEAAESIAKWALPTDYQKSPTIPEVMAALATVAKVLEGVIQKLPSEQHQVFEAKRRGLQDQLTTLKFITSLGPKDPGPNAKFLKRFQGSRDPAELFSNLIAAEHFFAAEEMWNSHHLRQYIGSEKAVESIIRLGPDVNPSEYATVLLENLIMPSLSISYELLPSLWAWSCKLADELDKQGCLEQAIILLQAIERGTNALQLRVHGSFSSFCPFLDRRILRHNKAPTLPKGSSTCNSSGSLTLLPASPRTPGSGLSTRNPLESAKAFSTFPTLLVLGHIKRGAMKSLPVSSSIQHVKRATGTGDDSEDAKEDRVREKLLNARCLEAARNLGLGKGAADLESFSVSGGMQSFANELVRFLSAAAKSHDERCSVFAEKYKPFCEKFSIHFNESLLHYLKGLCRSTNTTAESIQECASVAQCCDNVLVKCQGILVVLRAALFCKYSPPWLTSLSRDAVEWSAIDLGLRSELVEASRLLLIDGIARKYCGDEGGDLFRVDNPRHAVRLLEFITQHFRWEGALGDSLDLCDAFYHLSRLDATTALCTQCVSANNVEMCADTIEKIYEKDVALADSTCDRVVSFCAELISEDANYQNNNLPRCRVEKLRESAICGSTAACAILSIMFAKLRSATSESTTINHYSKIDMVYLESLKADFTRINEMQRNHSVFLTLTDLRCTATLLKIAASLLDPVVAAYVSGDRTLWNIKLSKARRACSLLAGACECSDMDFWCAAASVVSSPFKWAHNDTLCLAFMKDVGVLGGFQAASTVSSRAILSAAFSLCLKGSKQAMAKQAGFNENIGTAVSLIHDYLLLSCPDILLLQAQSLSTLTETVLNVLIRGDEGVGEKLEKYRFSLQSESWSSHDRAKASKLGIEDKDNALLPCTCRSLHPTWYIGDGLLLPPVESMSRSVKFCKDIMSSLSVSTHKTTPLSFGGIHGMIQFLFHRGALSVGIRLLSCSSALLFCSGVPDNALNALTSAFQDAHVALVERSLGGIGNGITNSMVDSQLAVSALLSLPMKLAFKVYTAAVPAARSTRDFSRVIALANIGVIAGGRNSGGEASTENVVIGWKNQAKLVAQCQRLSDKAVWWKFLVSHRIPFDHKLLDDKNLESKEGPSYAQSLIVPIITKLRLLLDARCNAPVHVILDIVSRYAATFGLQRGDVVEAYIGLLLSSYESSIHLLQVERSARALIPLLQPNLQRALVLRRCVVILEKNERLSKDYEHHALVLSMYLECLHSLRTTTQTQMQTQIFEAELEAIDRRSDALAILSSVFEGEKKGHRPAFPSFFRPLPADLSDYANGHATSVSCDILGKSKNTTGFDPLEALQGVLLRSYDVNTSKALAPLCLPLGLPSGYIHARFLMEHFRWSKKQQTTLPSFATDVLPVIRIIHSAGDKAALAEWCCSYYSCSAADEDRLQCLELALRSAILASNEAEQRKIRYTKNAKDAASLQVLAQEEQDALDLVERLSKAKSALSDKITVVTAVSKGSMSSSILVDQLLGRLQKSLWESPDALPAPEEVTEVLFREASLLAAEACVASMPLSMQKFRQFCSTVNSACHALSEQHSHIRTDQITSVMVRNFLFQGDDKGNSVERKVVQSQTAPLVSKPSKTVVPYDFSEDDTTNIVLDLNSIQVDEDQSLWHSEDTTALQGRKITADEELTSLKQSEREQYEEITVRVALRVAFVLACHENDRQGISESANIFRDNENSSAMANSRSASRSTGKGKGLLARIEKASTKQNNYVMECASDLLKIVFARPELLCESRFVANQEQKIVTFAMRHRALRSLAVLVPQDAVERLVSDEGYLGEETSLSQCTFGAFVADECEAIGLPLTHSDLSHISSIHYRSYARTLWRHHRDGNLKGSRGRLLLLLLEMSLKGEAEVDTAFIGLLLKEMRNLSRTLLLACESILACKDDLGSQKIQSIFSACSGEMHTAAKTSATSILGEIEEKLRTNAFASDEKATREACYLIRRLGFVVECFFGNTVDEAKQLSLASAREKLVDIEGQLQAVLENFRSGRCENL